MRYDPNIHQRRSIRLKGYDYSQAGAYFITICTQDRACLFGFVGAPLVGARYNDAIQNNDDVQNETDRQNNGTIQNKMDFRNDVGRMDDDGQQTGQPQKGRPQGHAPTDARNDDAPIMILNDSGKMIETEWLKLTERFPNIELHEFVVMPNHFHGILQIVDVSAAGKTIGDMMDAFKSITTVEYIHGVKQSGWEPFNRKLWQRNYHEHIIRDEQSYQRISDYIINNPANWKDDKFYNQ